MPSAGDIFPKPGTHGSCGGLRLYIQEIDLTALLTITERRRPRRWSPTAALIGSALRGQMQAETRSISAQMRRIPNTRSGRIRR
jgi:hypothetical protein